MQAFIQVFSCFSKTCFPDGKIPACTGIMKMATISIRVPNRFFWKLSVLSPLPLSQSRLDLKCDQTINNWDYKAYCDCLWSMRQTMHMSAKIGNWVQGRRRTCMVIHCIMPRCMCQGGCICRHLVDQMSSDGIAAFLFEHVSLTASICSFPATYKRRCFSLSSLFHSCEDACEDGSFSGEEDWQPPRIWSYSSYNVHSFRNRDVFETLKRLNTDIVTLQAAGTKWNQLVMRQRAQSFYIRNIGQYWAVFFPYCPSNDWPNHTWELIIVIKPSAVPKAGLSRVWTPSERLQGRGAFLPLRMRNGHDITIGNLFFITCWRSGISPTSRWNLELVSFCAK